MDLEPGEVIVRAWPVTGQFHIVRWPAMLSTQADDEFLQGLAQAWSAAGVRATRSRRRRTLEREQAAESLGNAVGACPRTGGGSDAPAASGGEGERYYEAPRSNSSRSRYQARRELTARRHGQYRGRDTRRRANSTWQSLSRNTGRRRGRDRDGVPVAGAGAVDELHGGRAREAEAADGDLFAAVDEAGGRRDAGHG